MSDHIQLPQESIREKIYTIRGYNVMHDSDLALLYGVDTKTFNRAVKRNRTRFPDDFMFQLNEKEYENLRRQYGTSNRGGRRYAPQKKKAP
ncbi:MAG: ORF6N domain-containing protein [Spirochaetes bacterium]|nr:ORF6N domain-containing protein [Spirochaetota bacterium]